MMAYDHLYSLVEDAYRDADVVELTVLDPGNTTGLVLADWHRGDRTLTLASVDLPIGLLKYRLGEILATRQEGIVICENMPEIDPMHDHLIGQLAQFAATVVDTCVVISPAMWKPWYRKLVAGTRRNPYDRVGKL